ncbi:lysm and putative peptidoglycan-binding domain-containing protein 2 [Phtheirospermum japonicum]|uniref:Lysm and putative peptidoglycan-binding domain-containing protein 2 n=1 Tax=Phtheirospermum japonicum TaxID=374723 RepID=A0A830CSP5_9LAMI|nr:lysm and putative peptidoglycan-binding domain-containing protein 2 [Phtheirospermum japonicum]
MEEERRTDDNNGGMDFFARVTVGSPPPSRSLPIPSPPSAAVGVALNRGVNHILHTVTKFDTLAGVAIKYGVEVADIKRLNGLVTDRQMFALKTLKIPLPGRHPPSPSLCNNHDHSSQRPISSSEKAPSNRRHSPSDLFDSFQSLKLKSSSEHQVSPAMRNLRGYYGLIRQTQTDDNNQKSTSEGFEMSVYHHHPLSHHRKSKSVANGLTSASGGNGLLDPLISQESENNTSSSDKWTIAKLLRRRQKSEADFTGKVRPNKSGGPNPGPIESGDDSLGGVRKSSSTSSTSSLQDDDSSDNNGSIWSTTSKWSLKPDFQALSSAAIIPNIARRNKAALD